MQSKTLVLVLFAAWSAICWRWYVCGIKESCGTKQQAPPAVVAAPAIEPDTTPATQQPAVQPGGKKSGISDTQIDRVQVEELADRVVIHFPYGSTRREDNYAIDDYLNRLARQLTTGGGTATITGHTDFVGDSKANYEFGLRRAYGIREILVKKGVKKAQIKCKSFGDRKPVATNDTALGRYKNRRAEIRVSK